MDEDGFRDAEHAALLDPMLRTLTDRDRLVVELRFRDDLTQAEIGRRVGCSQMQVSRILRAALAQLVEAARSGDVGRDGSGGVLHA